MRGTFSSYAPVRCANGEMGPAGHGYLSCLPIDDAKVWLYGRPRRGEGVKGWMRRQVEEHLAEYASRNRSVWWARFNWHVWVREEYGTRGDYTVVVVNDGVPGTPRGPVHSAYLKPVGRDGKLVRVEGA